MEELAFVLTLIVVMALFLLGAGFNSGAGSAGLILGCLLASAAYLGVYYLRNGKLM